MWGNDAKQKEDCVVAYRRPDGNRVEGKLQDVPCKVDDDDEGYYSLCKRAATKESDDQDYDYY